MSRPKLKEFYTKTIVAKLMKDFGYQNVMEVPRITKITLNMGVGEAVNDKKVVDHAAGDLAKIAGQKPIITKSRKERIRHNLKAQNLTHFKFIYKKC